LKAIIVFLIALEVVKGAHVGAGAAQNWREISILVAYLVILDEYEIRDCVSSGI